MAQPENPATSGQQPAPPKPKELIIADIGTEKSFPKGSIIVRQGDAPEGFYISERAK